MRLLISLMFILISATGYAGKCKGEYQKIFFEGDSIHIDCKRMVLMNEETFAGYYHDSKSLDELRKEVPSWAATIDSLKKEHDKKSAILDTIALTREYQAQLERESKEELISDLVDSEEKNTKLRKQNKGLRLFGTGTTGLCVIFLLILL